MKIYIISIILIILLAIAGFTILDNVKIQDQERGLGGVATSEASQSTSTAAMESGGAFGSEIIRTLVTTTPSGIAPSGDARRGAIILDSVVISSSTAHWMKIWNATSTTDISSTTVAVFDNDNNAAVGAYPFGLVLDRGLIIQFESGFFGSYNISYK